MIESFSGETRWLSNFYIEPDGTCVEKEFQAAKTHDIEEKIKILFASTPGQAKRMGRQVKLRADWEDVKFYEMRALVLRKFCDHPDLTAKLAATDGPLIEGNHWHDNFWGSCICQRCEQIEKKNALGLILMEIRKLCQ